MAFHDLYEQIESRAALRKAVADDHHIDRLRAQSFETKVSAGHQLELTEVAHGASQRLQHRRIVIYKESSHIRACL
jgi:hypothetical protein